MLSFLPEGFVVPTLATLVVLMVTPFAPAGCSDSVGAIGLENTIAGSISVDETVEEPAEEGDEDPEASPSNDVFVGQTFAWEGGVSLAVDGPREFNPDSGYLVYDIDDVEFEVNRRCGLYGTAYFMN